MLARMQRLIAISVAIFVAAFAWVAIASGRATWATAGLLAVVAIYVMVLGAEFIALRASFAASDPLRPRAGQLLRAWWLECTSTPKIFLWQQPFRSRAESDSLASAPRRGVVLIHGYVCNRGIWNSWMRRLRSEGIPFIAVDLEPTFGSIDDYVTTIDGAVRAIEQSTHRPPVIVSHSMGGLAARAWSARRDGALRCHAIVTIGSPHRGTWMARTSRTRNGCEMRIGSDWLHRLETREAASPPPRLICFWSHCDNIVFPSVNATLPAADSRHLEATPHVQMIFHPAVLADVLRLVDEPTAAPDRRRD